MKTYSNRPPACQNDNKLQVDHPLQRRPTNALYNQLPAPRRATQNASPTNTTPNHDHAPVRSRLDSLFP